MSNTRQLKPKSSFVFKETTFPGLVVTSASCMEEEHTRENIFCRIIGENDVIENVIDSIATEMRNSLGKKRK